VLSSITNGTWCPYCSNDKLCANQGCTTCYEKSFASHPKAIHWSDVNDKKPRDIFISSASKYRFDCIDCKHTFEMQLDVVKRGGWCPYCCTPTKKLCEEDDCQHCYEKSFASHPKAINWSNENNKEPRQVFKGTTDKYKFHCDTCNHVFQSTLNNVSKGQWCPNCKHKTERKLHEYLLSQNIPVSRQAKFDWCKNDETGKHLPFDFAIEDKHIIIEVDGLQHFEQVSNWKSPEETQQRDILKQKLAQENGYTVIRIFQEDVLYDSYDWKTKLMQVLVRYETPICLYMSKDENRYCNYKSITASS
jgi:very-short-patch-repair endonuclease